MNVINLTGRVVKDCELSMLPGTGTAKISFTICVERKYQKDKNNKKVDFIPVEMLGSHTEKLAQYVTKGKMIGIVGELHIDQYEKDGQKKSFTKVNADRFELPTSRLHLVLYPIELHIPLRITRRSIYAY